MAGIGFSLKPHYALLWLMLEGYAFYLRRRLTSERIYVNILILGIALFYLLWVYFRIPEYFEHIYPIIKYIYLISPGEHTFTYVINYSLIIGIWLVPVFYYSISYKIQSRNSAFLQFLFFGFLFSFIEFFTEFHSTGLQRVQLYTFGVLLTASLSLEFFRNITYYSWARTFCIIFLLLIMVMFYPMDQIVSAYTGGPDPNRTSMNTLMPYIDKYAKNKSFFILSPIVDYSFPLGYYANANWNYRYFTIPVSSFRYYESLDKSNFTPLEKSRFALASDYFYESLHLAMEENPPALIFAQEKPVWDKCGSKFVWYKNYSCWVFPDDFIRDPEFAREWKHYTRVDEIRVSNYSVLGVYVRQN